MKATQQQKRNASQKGTPDPESQMQYAERKEATHKLHVIYLMFPNGGTVLTEAPGLLEEE